MASPDFCRWRNFLINVGKKKKPLDYTLLDKLSAVNDAFLKMKYNKWMNVVMAQKDKSICSMLNGSN